MTTNKSATSERDRITTGTLYRELYKEDVPENFSLNCSRSDSIVETYSYLIKGKRRDVLQIRPKNHFWADVIGEVSLLKSGGEGASKLEKYFRNPFKPTEEEKILFEIDSGFEYPILADKSCNSSYEGVE